MVLDGNETKKCLRVDENRENYGISKHVLHPTQFAQNRYFSVSVFSVVVEWILFIFIIYYTLPTYCLLNNTSVFEYYTKKKNHTFVEYLYSSKIEYDNVRIIFYKRNNIKQMSDLFKNRSNKVVFTRIFVPSKTKIIQLLRYYLFVKN